MVLFLRLLLFWFLGSLLLTDVKVAAEDVMLLKKEDGTDTHDDDTEDGDGDDGDDGDDVVEEEGTIQAEAIAVGRTISVVVVVVAFVDGTCCPFPSFVFSSSSSSATSLFPLFVGTIDVVLFVTVVFTPLRNND